MSFSVFEKIDPSCQNGSMEKAKNIPYHQRPYASIAERTLVDISTYSPRPQIAGTGHSHSKISIHSPRAGRDCRYPNAPLITQISIHSPRMGRDAEQCHRQTDDHISTHSPRMGRDATPGAPASPGSHFNPLSPHGERPVYAYFLAPIVTFQSTLPAWGERPCTVAMFLLFYKISIHSPRMGSDVAYMARAYYWQYISIHSPRMGRDPNL